MSEIKPAEPLRYPKSIRVGMPMRIKPALVVEAGRFDLQRTTVTCAVWWNQDLPNA
jgi:hypothetical protein